MSVPMPFIHRLWWELRRIGWYLHALVEVERGHYPAATWLFLKGKGL